MLPYLMQLCSAHPITHVNVRMRIQKNSYGIRAAVHGCKIERGEAITISNRGPRAMLEESLMIQ
jgi:hypothetical protein